MPGPHSDSIFALGEVYVMQMFHSAAMHYKGSYTKVRITSIFQYFLRLKLSLRLTLPFFKFLFDGNRFRITSVTLYSRLMGCILPFLVGKIEQAGVGFIIFLSGGWDGLVFSHVPPSLKF